MTNPVHGSHGEAQSPFDRMPGSPDGSPARHGGSPGAFDDGEWHRLHPLSLWGNLFSALFGVGWVLVVLWFSLRGNLPLTEQINPSVVQTVAIACGVAILIITVVWRILAYRFTEFRLGDEVVELREGVLSRSHKQVRYDRLQSVNMNRPFIARVFGLTQVETSSAGDESDIKLRFLGVDEAAALRAELLRRASGAKQAKEDARAGGLAGAASGAPGAAGSAPGAAGSAAGAMSGPGHPALLPHPDAQQGAYPGGVRTGITGAPVPMGMSGQDAAVQYAPHSLRGFIDRAVADLSAPELSQAEARAQSVVSVHPGRIIGAMMLNAGVVLVIVYGLLFGVLAVGLAMIRAAEGLPADAIALFGGVIGTAFAGTSVFGIFISLVVSANGLLNHIQYTIASTPDGVRIGRGLLNLTNDTIPPGRIHAFQIEQPLLWRMFGWYRIRINRADVRLTVRKDESGSAADRFIVLPVGTFDDVNRVLQLVLPMHMNAHTAQMVRAAFRRGRQPEYTPAPGRAWWLHPFSIRFIGGAIDSGLVYFRRGWLLRQLTMMPGERIQSVTSVATPIGRLARVANVRLDTVRGPVRAVLPAVPAEHVNGLHGALAELAVTAARSDTSHRWAQARVQALLASAHLRAEDARHGGAPLDEQSKRVLAAEAQWRSVAGVGGRGAGGDGGAARG